jgi:hypothetical protein
MVVARRFAVLLAIVPMWMVLLATAPGVRLALRDAKLASSTTLRPVATQAHVDRADRASDDRHRAAAPRLESASDTDPGTSASDPSETSDSNEPPNDQDDGDGDGDEMIVWCPDRIPGASVVALLWHETPKLSGVIHSPEPRPARRA